MSNGQTKHNYGKYRGYVVNNSDPEQRGRIPAIVPDGHTTPTSWAMPCLPMAGIGQGVYMVPPVGAAVWIESERGDPDYPIWVGGFWNEFNEIPQSAVTPMPTPPGQTIVLQTTLHYSLVISDAPRLPVTAPVPAPAPSRDGWHYPAQPRRRNDRRQPCRHFHQ